MLGLMPHSNCAHGQVSSQSAYSNCMPLVRCFHACISAYHVVLSSFNGDLKTINLTLLLESAVSVLSGDNQLSAGDERPLKRARLNAPTVSDDQHVEAQQTVPPLASLLRVRDLPEQFSRCNPGQIWPTCALHQL
jgi:hypothetical protein